MLPWATTSSPIIPIPTCTHRTAIYTCPVASGGLNAKLHVATTVALLLGHGPGRLSYPPLGRQSSIRLRVHGRNKVGAREDGGVRCRVSVCGAKIIYASAAVRHSIVQCNSARLAGNFLIVSDVVVTVLLHFTCPVLPGQ